MPGKVRWDSLRILKSIDSMDKDIVLTPMMKQFLDLKAKHPDALMLFRCGDFYETYSTDAVVASEILASP